MATQTQVLEISPVVTLPSSKDSVGIEHHDARRIRHHTAAAATESESRSPSSSPQDSEPKPDPGSEVKTSLFRNVIVTLQLAGVNFTSSATNGLVVVGLPAITADLNIPQALALWPTSVASLTNASTLLLAGAIADSIGPRYISLSGCLISGVFMLGAGLSQTGPQLVVMRALQGVGYAMHLASSVAIVTQAIPRGRTRNFTFGCLGLSQPLGFSFGLVIGGVLQEALGWRAAWFIYSGLTLFLTCLATWALPQNKAFGTTQTVFNRFKKNVDWVGALLASAFMCLLSYLFATLSTDLNKVRNPESIIFICLSVITLPAFLIWVHRQVRLGRPALIPNAIWKNTAFSAICLTVALSFGVTTSMELFASLFFQDIQHLSALQAGIRILPSLVVGIILNFATGLFVDRVPARLIVTLSSVLSAIAPLLMAVIQPSWTYWANAFVAQILCPVSADILFTVGLIIISDVFPDDMQALAGAVFNTSSQFGQALCLAVMQIISTHVTKDRGGDEQSWAVMEGLRASFWAMFAFMMLCGGLGLLGLRNTGRIGLKRD